MSNRSVPPTRPTHPSSLLKESPSGLFTWLCDQPVSMTVSPVTKLHTFIFYVCRSNWTTVGEKSQLSFQSHDALIAFTCIKELAPRILPACLQASTQLLDKPATASQDLPTDALPDLPTRLKGDFLYTPIPWGWQQGPTELVRPLPLPSSRPFTQEKSRTNWRPSPGRFQKDPGGLGPRDKGKWGQGRPLQLGTGLGPLTRHLYTISVVPDPLAPKVAN